MDLAVAELLEEAEQKALQKQNNKARDEEPEPVSRDPRRHGRENGNKEPRSNHDRYSLEREENDERRSRRSKDLAEDEEMKDSSDKGSANGSVRSRRRSRSPDRRRGSPRDRDNYRERDRGDFYRSGGRPPVDREDDDRYYRPSGRSRKDDDRPPTRDRDRRDDRRADRDVDRYRSGRDGRDRRRSPEPPRKQKTPEPTDDERDRRTVFVQQLAARLRTKELIAFFEQVGPVKEAQIVKDRVSGRSKG